MLFYLCQFAPMRFKQTVTAAESQDIKKLRCGFICPKRIAPEKLELVIVVEVLLVDFLLCDT